LPHKFFIVDSCELLAFLPIAVLPQTQVKIWILAGNLLLENSSLSQWRSLAAIAVNERGAKILQPLAQNPEITLWLPQSLSLSDAKSYSGSFSEQIARLWKTEGALIFCACTGVVIRAIAPYLKDKSQDPAVIAIDSEGRFVISLCSGHQGGADLLTRLIAAQLGATPIITSASDLLNLPAIDTFGSIYGWVKGEGDWTGVMAAVTKGTNVEVIQEAGSSLWQQHLPASHTFKFGDEANTSDRFGARIWISPTKRQFAPKSDFPKVQWHPRVLWVGIGCERNTSSHLIAAAIDNICRQYHLATSAIAGLATIDLKADEVGILELCRQRNLPLKTFSSESLSLVKVPTPSNIVRQEVGTPSVAEAAAILASESDLLVNKQIFKQEGEPGAVTVAIGRAKVEYTGRTGKLYLVGIGPGSIAQITPAAKTAIIEADAIIGYSLYLDLIKPLLRSTQIIEALPITQEKQRAQRAISLAQWGLTVAVISSGDCGIYGMAGLVLEELQISGWDGVTPQVKLFPGISALQAAASKVGAPLMHDFCAISLSDLLTPWEVIEKRLEASAMADFITAIYNPRSQKRTHQIEIARKIFLQHRSPDTPVAIVKEAYRDNEKVILTTLDKMLEHSIDMLTTVIIGNKTTRNHANWMITPRGYKTKTRMRDEEKGLTTND
jgi:cobalt-precorrin 5A hydrolase/precorrin-3B C17-methyltransferase